MSGELDELGLGPAKTSDGAVRFSGDQSAMIEANLRLRTASRVLWSVHRSRVQNPQALYDAARRVAWEKWIPSEKTFAVQAFTNDPKLSDYRSVALRVKDAIVDRQRQKAGRRSNVDRRRPEVPVVCHISESLLEISLDTSGRPLHERGYRTEAGEAPLRETVAAGILRRSHWDGKRILLDPFCGSGTIPIEAALAMRSPRAAPERHDYAFLSIPAFAQAGTEALNSPVHARADATLPRICASDRDPAMIEIARRNAERAGVGAFIDFREADAGIAGSKGPAKVFGLAPEDAGLIVTNPPYGARLDDIEVKSLYRGFSDLLKADFTSWDAWILTEDSKAARSIALRPDETHKLFNGSLRCRLSHFGLY